MKGGQFLFFFLSFDTQRKFIPTMASLSVLEHKNESSQAAGGLFLSWPRFVTCRETMGTLPTGVATETQALSLINKSSGNVRLFHVWVNWSHWDDRTCVSWADKPEGWKWAHVWLIYSSWELTAERRLTIAHLVWQTVYRCLCLSFIDIVHVPTPLNIGGVCSKFCAASKRF